MKGVLSKQIDELSRRMHARTGYSIRHAVLEGKYELAPYYPNDFFIFNSPEWGIFLEIIDEACR